VISVQVSTIIHRPIADVFAFVSNFENHPKWETDFLEVKQLAKPDGLGTLYLCVLKFPGQRATSRFTITEYEPNHKIAFEGEPAGPATPKGSYLFESVADGTRITSAPRPEFRGVFKLLEPLMARYIRQSNEAHLRNLKNVLEG
jgi:hypothetical protein